MIRDQSAYRIQITSGGILAKYVGIYEDFLQTIGGPVSRFNQLFKSLGRMFHLKVVVVTDVFVCNLVRYLQISDVAVKFKRQTGLARKTKRDHKIQTRSTNQ